MRILLAEDDELLGEGLSLGLQQRQYTVDWVKNGAAALSAAQSEHFDMIVLDLILPKMTGDEVLHTIRKKNILTPVIILTAIDSPASIVKNFDYGADDYLTKPFSLDELCARIRAVCRRFSTNSTVDNVLKNGNLSMNLATRVVTLGGEQVELSRREFALLQLLIENLGKVIPRSQAIQSIYGWGIDIDSNALEVHVHNLRHKLKLNNVRTIRGIGYVMDSEDVVAEQLPKGNGKAKVKIKSKDKV